MGKKKPLDFDFLRTSQMYIDGSKETWGISYNYLSLFSSTLCEANS